MPVAKVVRKPGDRFGSSDAPRPDLYPEYMLSRVMDVLDTAPTPEERRAFWDNLPYNLKLDYNYSQWSYVAPDPWHPDHESCARPYMSPRPRTAPTPLPPTPSAPDPLVS